MLFPVSPPPCLAPASCFQGCSFHPSLSCLSTVTVGIQQWRFWVGAPVPLRQRQHFWRACLQPAPLGYIPSSPFGHKSSLKCGAALCSCCLQGTEVFTATQAPFPAFPLRTTFGKQGSHPRFLRAGCTSSWGLERDSCVGFFPFSLSAGTLLPQLSLWLLFPSALVPREPQAAAELCWAGHC